MCDVGTMVTKRHPGGRPPLSTSGSTVVSVRLPNAKYDALIAAARLRGEDVSVIIREALEAGFILDSRQTSR